MSGGTVFAEAIRVKFGLRLIGQNIPERLSRSMEWKCLWSQSMVEPAEDGMTTPELGQLMNDLGAVDAINFDGGGSTT